MLARWLIILLVLFFRCGVCNVVKRSSECRGNVCEFRWIIDYKFTMMWYNKTAEGPEYQPIVQDSKGFIRRRSTTPNCSETHEAVSLDEFKELVSTGDGDYRMVYAINGKIPGPEIIVTEGDVVAVLIYNRLKMEGVTIHWHGLLHKGTPWMDGASMISQCPIMPGQVFEYRFIAEPVGTHWYHAHTNTMRNDGLSGAFIVLPKQQSVLRFHGEFFAVIQDWTKRSAAETAETYRSSLFGLEDYDGTCKPAKYMPDGTASIFSLNVGLVNGRGRRYTENDIENGEKPFIPMETFTVRQMGTYRFRIVNVGFAQPFEISFEAHTIYVVAMDGNDVEEQKCDAVVISPGESVDIKLTAKRRPNNYYINFKTIPTKTLWGPIARPQLTRAVLNYNGVNRFRRPVSVPRLCTLQNPCYVVNQIYGKAPIDSNAVVIPLTRLKSTYKSLIRFPVPVENDQSHLRQFFLNFHFFRGHPAINGRRFMYPTSSLQGQNNRHAITQCKPPRCTSERCRCTNMIKLEIGNVIQFVFFTRGLKAAHPIHFHGHQFHVVKIGFPEYDPVTGNAIAPNSDIKCLNDDCTEATWADPRWIYDVPGLNLWNPPIKDTVNVPWGGYVVVRIIADNPGYWLLHCHLGHHQSQGMSLVLQEGDPADMVEPPPGFPTCSSFKTSTKAIQSAINKQKEILERKKKRAEINQPQIRRTSQGIQHDRVDMFFQESSNKAENQAENIWSQTPAKGPSELTVSTARITAGSFPQLPSARNEITTVMLPSRIIPDTTFDKWPQPQSWESSSVSSNGINANSLQPLPVSGTNDVPTLPSQDYWNGILGSLDQQFPTQNPHLPVSTRRTTNDITRPLYPSAGTESNIGPIDFTSFTTHDNLIPDTTISEPFPEIKSDPFSSFGSLGNTQSLTDISFPGTSNTDPLIGLTDNTNPFADTTSISGNTGSFSDISIPGTSTNDLFVGSIHNKPFSDTSQTQIDPFADTIGNIPFADTSSVSFTDTSSNNPLGNALSSVDLGDTTSNGPFPGISSNDPFLDSTSNIPITDTTSSDSFGQLTSFYGSARTTDPVLFQSPSSSSGLDLPFGSSGTSSLPSSSISGFSSDSGLTDSSGSSSFTDSQGNLNEFFIG